jgi:predicted nucleic-acid-binding Zn-ribbon protein
MFCPKCAYGNRVEFSAEINIHFSGLRNLDRPSVLVFPKVLVCLNCGFAEFTIPEKELPHLAQGAA